MDSKQDFFEIIYNHYAKIVGDKISAQILHDLSECVAEYYYKQYGKFKNQYPKSAKRYSSFQIKDLDHPQTFELIINLLKEKMGSDYSKYTTLLLNISATELSQFEKTRKDYHNM